MEIVKNSRKEGFAEYETRIGLVRGDKIAELISTLLIPSAETLIDISHERTKRNIIFYEKVGVLGEKSKYKSLTVIEGPKNIVRFKVPLKEDDELRNIVAMREIQIPFDPMSDNSRRQAIENAFKLLKANPTNQIVSPAFIKDRWSNIVRLADGTKVEIAGDRCVIQEGQTNAEYRKFEGNSLFQVEIELMPPIDKDHILRLRSARAIVFNELRRQKVSLTHYTPSKSIWIKNMLIDEGLMTSGPKGR